MKTSPVGSLERRPAGGWRAGVKHIGPFQSALLLGIALALLAPVCALAQSQTLILNAPPPAPVGSVTVQLSTSGTGFFCYWVVAIYPIGKAYPTGPACVNNAAATITVRWDAAAGATGYDVLRQSTRTLPSGLSNSSVSTNVACCSQTDSLGPLSAYTVAGTSPAQASFRLDNQAQPQPVVVADTPLAFGTTVLKPTTGVTRFANAVNWVFEGDSLTAGHGLSKSADNTPSCVTSLSDATCLDWPSQFVLMSSTLGRVASKNIPATSGATIAIIQARYTASVHPLSPAVTGIPAVLSVWVGANDIAFIAPATWEAAVTTYLTAAKADGFTILFWTTQRRGDLADSTGADDSRRLLFNQWSRAQMNAGLFDYLVDVDRLMTNPFDTSTFQSDTIHENAAAQYIIAKYVNGIFWEDSITLPTLSTDSPQGSGLGNVILNVDAGGDLTTGPKNFFGGWWAGRLATTAADNTLLGWNAGRAITTQFSNTAVGALAFQTGTGSQNTAVGHESANFVTGNNNTCMGFRACFTVVGGANNAALGQGADFGASTNNAVQLGTGANSSNNTLQFRAFNFLTDAGVAGPFTGLSSSGTVDYHSASRSLPHRSGTGSPVARDNCTAIGETYFQTDATAGSNIFGCTAAGSPGTWNLEGGGGAGDRQISMTFDGGGLPLSGTATRCVPQLVAATIQSASIISDVSGSITIDVQTVAQSSYTGPGSATTIKGAGASPALSSATQATPSLTSWTTAIAANSVVCFAMSAPATVTWATLTLDVR